MRILLLTLLTMCLIFTEHDKSCKKPVKTEIQKNVIDFNNSILLTIDSLTTHGYYKD